MLIVKAPLRISIGGGGTDLPSYYENFGSEFISAAINKYIYVSVHEIFRDEIIIKYSELERVHKHSEIKHPIVREVMQMTGPETAVEVSSFADIPSGTGLGSSGTFTVALLKGLYTYNNISHTNISIAEMACKIEIEKLGAPIGKQDQYISAIGGLTRFKIDKQGLVSHSPLKMNAHDLRDLEDHLMLFFTGYSRSANDLLKEQNDKTLALPGKLDGKSDKNEMIENLHMTKELGIEIGLALEKGQVQEFGRLMNVHWEHKKKRSQNMSSGRVNEWYELALKNGAIGGKLIGAGGGGFLMFLAEDKRRLRKTLREAGMQEVDMRFDQLGVQVVLND
jgi:D-glycero-alpha-D-manno-heptose-7-phosphate kinase